MTREQHFEAVISEHGALLKAIRNQDADDAEGLAANHARLFRQRVVDYLSSQDDGSVAISALNSSGC